jgi:hypothetical protein
MLLKDFGENSDVSVEVRIVVNDEVVFEHRDYDIDGAIQALGDADRHHVIGKAIEQQFFDLPEPIQDEEMGF